MLYCTTLDVIIKNLFLIKRLIFIHSHMYFICADSLCKINCPPNRCNISRRWCKILIISFSKLCSRQWRTTINCEVLSTSVMDICSLLLFFSLAAEKPTAELQGFVQEWFAGVTWLLHHFSISLVWEHDVEVTRYSQTYLLGFKVCLDEK